MCPMLLNSFSDGPTMVLSPPQQHTFLPFPRQPVLDPTSGAGPRSLFSTGVRTHPFSSGISQPFSGNSTSVTSNAVRPSKKRSRDDMVSEEAHISTMPAPARAPQAEPIYGEGMVLLNPNTGMALSADSQTGTWYEEVAENTINSTPTALSQNNAPEASRKFQRLDPSAPGLDDIAFASMQRRLHGNDKDDNRRLLNATTRSNPFAPEEPQVDDATHLLGISWQRIQTDDEDMAAAVRGWKKYIDKQFSAHLVESDILMKNRALNAFLVSARPVTPMGPANISAFYLFSDDLTQAQLVGSTWEACFRNLQSSPIMFEGSEVLNASDKPLRNSSPQSGNGLLGINPVDDGLPLLQTLCAQPVSTGQTPGLNDGLGMGMEIDV